MKRKLTYTTTLGSISNGTMLPEDLIPAFASELRHLMRMCRVERIQRKTITVLLAECRKRKPGPANSLCDPSLLADMIDALETFAPPHAYFGAHPDDGADYGFWPIIDDDDLPKLDAHEYPWVWAMKRNYLNDVYLVNDHGNVDCGRFDKRGRFHTYWSVV